MSKKETFETFLQYTNFENDKEMQNKRKKYSVEDLQNAQKKAYEKGISLGREESDQSLQAKLLNVDSQIELQIKSLVEKEKSHREEFLSSTVQVAHAITRKILPQLAKGKEINEINALIQDALRVIKNPIKLRVDVHPEISDSLKKRLNALKGDREFEIIIQTNPDIDITDCRIQWASGGYERNCSQIWKDIDHALNAYLKEGMISESPLKPKKKED